MIEERLARPIALLSCSTTQPAIAPPELRDDLLTLRSKFPPQSERQADDCRFVWRAMGCAPKVRFAVWLAGGGRGPPTNDQV